MANSTDIYQIASEVEELQRKYIDEDQEVLSVGLYGYLGDQFTTMIQNNIMMTSEWGNEAFPTRARFEKTILSNAISYNINNINAYPATMDMRIGIVKDTLDKVMDDIGKDMYIINKNTEFKVGEFLFRLEYNIKIVRKKRPSGEYIYYAMNSINGDDYVYENPYLSAPIFIDYKRDKYIFFDTKLKQMQVSTMSRRTISNSLLDNKVIDFTFTDQLYKFEVKVKQADGTVVNVKPIFEGEFSPEEKFCNYYYTTPHNIRIKFNRLSFLPSLNDEIEITIYTTHGDAGNMNMDEEILFTSSYNGKILHGVVIPTGPTYGGLDRKTIEDLKNIIPKERLSRSILSNDRDLENFFNTIDLNTRLKFFKKRHNQVERCYYSYLLVKDSIGNVIPTNTLDINLHTSAFIYEDKYVYVLPPNVPLFYAEDGNCYPLKIESLDDVKTYEQLGFMYTCPFIMTLNKKPLFVSYYLNVLDELYDFNYAYINTKSDFQFMTSKMKIYKNHIFDNDNYYLSFNIRSNMNDKIFIEDEGDKVNAKLHPVLCLVKNGFKYYTEGKIIREENATADTNRDSYRVEFKLKTNNVINGGINIEDIYQFGGTTKVNASIPDEVDMEIYLYVEDLEKPDLYSDEEISKDYPLPNDNYKGYILANKLIPREKVVLYYDYTEIMNSTAIITDTVGEKNEYTMVIKSVPLVKYSYMQDLTRCDEFISYVQRRKRYTDYALERLENNFTIDFKFFNTYGPSRMFNVRKDTPLDKVNIDVYFAYRPKLGANTSIVELMIDEAKEYIENINSIESIHIMNLIAHLKDTFDNDVEFIEFRGINKYDTSYQYIEKQPKKVLDDVPEFININLDKNQNPGIHFELI